MIKPVTFQGVINFRANLYALEVKSRFIDQSKANGYYKSYGNELAATVIGGAIQIGTGAFVVQGRMSEIVTAESVSPTMTNGYVGYVVARVETYHLSDEENCTLKAYIGTSLADISLTQNDIYQRAAEDTNKIYELPIYSFAIQNGTITNLVKLIKPIEDYATVKAIADNALASASTALTKATTAEINASAAKTTANTAKSTADTAKSTADTAKETANATVITVNEQHAEMTAEIAELAQQIAVGQGTMVTLNGVGQATFPADGVVNEADIITLSGGAS